MAVSSTTRKQNFTLDGIEDEFTFTFRALVASPEDIKCSVTTNSVTTVLTYTTNYSVSVNSDGVGGTVTLVSTATIGLGTLTVYRETTNTQESDYDDYNQFPANTIETDLDRRTMVEQEQSEALDRCPKLPIESAITDIDFPEPSANKGLKWNAAADAIVNTVYDAETDALAAATSATAALASQLAAATSATTASSHATSALTFSTNALSHSTTALTASTTAASYATTALTHSNTALSHATTALTYSNTALSHSTTALTAATTALSHSTNALTYSNISLSHSTTALTYSNTALSYSTTALTHSNTALSYSTTALTHSNTALSYSTTALTHSNTALAYSLASATYATTSQAAATTATLAVQISVNEVTDDYILSTSDANKLVDLNTAGAVTLTVPSYASVAIPIGTVIALRQKGAGQVTITTDGSVTINNADGLKTTAQYALAALLKIDTNTWVATGSLET